MKRRTADWQVRFWKYVTFEPNSGCWLWTGAASNGYGTLGVGSRMIRATHLSLKIHCGTDVSGVAMHSCDQPLCVNPAHLSDGTMRDNVQDMIGKDRHSSLTRRMLASRT